MGEDEGDAGQRERDVVEGRGRDRVVAFLLLAVGGLVFVCFIFGLIDV